jgi:hypothetical protein
MEGPAPGVVREQPVNQSGTFPGLLGPKPAFRVPYVHIGGFRALRVAANFPNQSTSLDSRSVAQPG